MEAETSHKTNTKKQPKKNKKTTEKTQKKKNVSAGVELKVLSIVPRLMNRPWALKLTPPTVNVSVRLSVRCGKAPRFCGPFSPARSIGAWPPVLMKECSVRLPRRLVAELLSRPNTSGSEGW